MQVLNRDDYENNKLKFQRLLENSVFIYPTDTIYGIGCNATKPELVERIRKIKGTDNPFSIIIPSKKWIKDNCIITDKAVDWIDRLPGPYTLIFKLKNPAVVAPNVSSKDTIGVRMPCNSFAKLIKELGFPIITTSANTHGGNFMTSLDDLPNQLKQQVDYIFYDGEIKGKPSTIVHLEGEEVKVRERK